MSTHCRNRELELTFPAEKRVVHDVRVRFEEFLKPCHLLQDDLEWIKVAVSEACTNAICHGSPHGAASHIRVRCEVAEDRLIIEVCDEGGGFHPEEIALPPTDEWKPSGRGLVIMVTVMDSVEFVASHSGTCVRMTKLLRNIAQQPPVESPREAKSAHPRLQPAG
ncbi:MAG TPA: ATP-binding protein [Armatimonadota bacterium]|nr:ATP-binding protein [Armatimonadota bacterium]